MGKPHRDCKHCGKFRAIQSRGLCFGCWGRKSIRDLYPVAAGYEHRDHGFGFEEPVGVPEPTQALPGTPEKIRVMQERLERRQELFHECDPVDVPSAPLRLYRFVG